MAFTENLGSLVTNSDEAAFLFKVLCKKLEDVGGSTHHLNRLLGDARGDKLLLTSLAKEIVGPIWKFVDTTTKLMLIRFAADQAELIRLYPTLRIDLSRESIYAARAYPKPSTSCRYGLVQLSKHTSRPILAEAFFEDAQSLTKLFDGKLLEAAGLFEAISFASLFVAEQLRGVKVLVTGSLGRDPFLVEVTEEDACIKVRETLGHTAVANNQFCLVRVYD